MKEPLGIHYKKLNKALKYTIPRKVGSICRALGPQPVDRVTLVLDVENRSTPGSYLSVMSLGIWLGSEHAGNLSLNQLCVQ